MDNTNLNQVFEDAKAEIGHYIDEFKAELEIGTSEPDQFISLSEIENKWAELRNKTSKTYSDIISAYLSNVKESTGKRG